MRNVAQSTGDSPIKLLPLVPTRVDQLMLNSICSDQLEKVQSSTLINAIIIAATSALVL